MKSESFWWAMAVIVLSCALYILQLYYSSNYQHYCNLYIIAVGVLAVFNIVVFYLARRYARTSDDRGYMRLIFGNFLIKMIMVIGIPVTYFLISKPKDNNFIIPFVIIYVIFTIFESWYLNRSALMRKPQ